MTRKKEVSTKKPHRLRQKSCFRCEKLKEIWMMKGFSPLRRPLTPTRLRKATLGTIY